MKIKELKNERVAVYGVGSVFKENIKYLDTVLDILCFSDSNESKWGMEPLSDGRKCVKPDELSGFFVKTVIIAVENSSAIEAIRNRLNKYRFNIVPISELLTDCIRNWELLQFDKLDPKSYKTDRVEEGQIARYVECYMLRQACNLRCSYCFVGQSRELAETVILLKHSPDFIAKALSKDRLGGTSLISICCDGEPLISHDMVILIRKLLEDGHFVYLISNGTLRKRMDEICSFPQKLLNHLFIRFSYHYFELQRLNLFDIFFENIRRFHKAGGSFTVFLVGSDIYLPVLDDLKERCVKNLGALPHVDYERDETKGDGGTLTVRSETEFLEYKKIWNSFDSEFMRFREKVDGKIRGNCNAGNWVVHLDLMTGRMSRCPVGQYVGNIYDDICSDIPFDQKPHECPYNFCVCAPVFFAFGMKEDLRDAPTFYELWNRTTLDGVNWIQDEMRGFLNGRLYESHKL